MEKEEHGLKRLDAYRLQAGNGIIYLDERLEKTLCPQALAQVKEAARLPDSKVLVMPDIHAGYGLPIGGVLASKEFISAEAVGVDINCGVRLLSLNLSFKKKGIKLKDLLREFLQAIPAGVGEINKVLKGQDVKKGLSGVLMKGSSFIIEEMGYGRKEDLLRIEDGGRLLSNKGVIQSILKSYSSEDIRTFFYQLGTLGSGNHFLEVQEISEIFDQEKAKAFGVNQDSSLIMLHTGSRGFGNSLAQRYIKEFKKKAKEYGLGKYKLPAIPAASPMGEEYFYAMNGAANYAFGNRQLITSLLEATLQRLFGHSCQVKTIYDLAHNIAKKEMHHSHYYYVHRKGATRAFASGSDPRLPEFQRYGHPVLIPGSMGTRSFLVTGTQKAMEETFGTVSHGAGRIISRREAKRTLNEQEFKRFQKKNVILSGSGDNLLDEAPEAYKDSMAVISVLEGAGLIQPVLSLKPVATIKG